MDIAKIRKIIALCLIALCFASTFGLYFLESSAKWCLMLGALVGLASLFLCIFKPWKPTERTKQTSPQTPKTVIEAPSHEAVSTPSIPQLDLQSKIDELEKKLQQQQEMVFQYKEIYTLLGSFEKTRIKAFEERLEKMESEPTEEEINNLFEEFVDMGLLAMDFVNTQTRLSCSYAELTRDLINNKRDKQTIIFSATDSSTRLSNTYKWMSRILQAKLPGKSFFYSGYKL